MRRQETLRQTGGGPAAGAQILRNEKRIFDSRFTRVEMLLNYVYYPDERKGIERFRRGPALDLRGGFRRGGSPFFMERKKRIGAAAACLGLLLAGCGGGAPPSDQELWAAAMADAVFSEDDEVMELVCLTRQDPQVIWDEAGERVLLVTWHGYEEPCRPGEALAHGDIWATSLGELTDWYLENGGGVTDWELRFSQLLGMPDDGSCTRFSAFWIAPAEVIRPAYVTDVTAQMKNGYDQVTDPAYQDWFDDNILYSYFESAYPWTRLGYTYDWSGGPSPYGLTEFLVADGSKAEIAFTCSTADFVAWLDTRS